MGRLQQRVSGQVPTYFDEGVPLESNIRLNFIGGGVTATTDPGDPELLNVSIPGTAGATGIRENTLTYGRNAAGVVGGTYLRTTNGVATNTANSPPRLPIATTLIAASVGVDGAPGSSWGIEIEVNGVVVATLTDATGALDTVVGSSLSVAVAAGDKVGVRVSVGSAAVNRPVAVLVFQR